MHQIDLHEAKVHLADLIDRALGGEEVILTQNNQPVLKLVRVAALGVGRKAGSAKGLITVSEDFDEPLEDFREYLR
jgi:prevent-host-death family protein